MVDKPIIMDTTDNEGYGFIPFVFWGIGQNVTVIEEKFHTLIDFLFTDENDSQEVVKSLYPCPSPFSYKPLALNSSKNI